MHRWDALGGKTIEGVRSKTALGAAVSLVAALAAVFLIVSETRAWLSVDVEEHMDIDLHAGGGPVPVHLELNISFPNIACDRLEFKHEATRGGSFSEDARVVKAAEAGGGCNVHAAKVVDKVAGVMKLTYNPSEEERTAMARVPSGLSQQHLMQPPQLVPPGLNLSHTLHEVVISEAITGHAPNEEAIIDALPELRNSLNGRFFVADEGIGLHQYSIQVVPTRIRRLGSSHDVRLSQYSFTERSIPTSFFRGVSSAMPPGLLVSYDYYPVCVRYVEGRESAFEFITSLCAIVGGTVTVLGLMGRFLVFSAKALQGKAD